MQLVLVPLLLLAYILAYTFRTEGLPLPWTNISLDLWALFVKDTPQGSLAILLECLLIFLPITSLAHLVFYMEPQRTLFKRYKLNPNFPSRSLVLKEVLRSLRGVSICAFLQVTVHSLHRHHWLPFSWGLNFLQLDQDGLPYLPGLVAGFLLLHLWADGHFYLTHRLLHSSWLYSRVHKQHHEATNPGPFSGLSMHWLESSIYFTSSLLAAPFVPLWIFRLFSLGQLVFPLEEHLGYDLGFMGNHHYIHHTKFNYNFGNYYFDWIFGTVYTAQREKAEENLGERLGDTSYQKQG